MHVTPKALITINHNSVPAEWHTLMMRQPEKKKAAVLFLWMHLREHVEQLLQAPATPLTGNLSYFTFHHDSHFILVCMCACLSSIRQHTYLVLYFIFQGRGKPRPRRKSRSMWVRKLLSDKRRDRYGHYYHSTK